MTDPRVEALTCRSCRVLCFPSAISGARLCPSCAEQEATAAKAKFDGALETIIALVNAGDFTSALPLAEWCWTESLARFRLDIAYQIERTLPGLRAQALAQGCADA